MTAVVYLAPGVFVQEVDISQYVNTLSTTLLGVVTTATKGPVNQNVLITDMSDLTNNFGIPDENHSGLLVVRNFLMAGGTNANVVRVSDTTDVAATATINLLSSSSEVLTAATSGSFYNNLAAVVSYGQQSPQTVTATKTFTASTATTETLANVPIAPGTLQISIASTVVATDDGNGNIVFVPSGALDHSSVGTVSYTTGVVSITPGAGFTTLTSVATTYSYNNYSTFNLQLVLTVQDSDDVTVSVNILEQYNGLTVSTFVAALANSANLAQPVPTPAHFPIAGTYAFTAGTDGISAITDAEFIGNTLGSSPTGLQIFGYPQEIDVNLVAIPGRSSSSITEALVQLVSIQRGDALALLDPPSNTTVQTVADWANAAGSYSANEVINSTYAAIYFPWYSSNNSINNNVDLAPPSAAAVQAFARSQYWQAPAGPNRGLLSDFAGISLNLSPGDRQFLGQNRVNPIGNLNGLGVQVLGQETATLTSSSLDRVGARMTLLQMEKAISTVMYSLLFEPNNAVTWAQAVNIVQPYLTSLVNANRIYAGVIYCDGVTNTPTNVNNNTMVAVVVVTLPKYAERIILNFECTAYGTTITESLVSTAVSNV